MNLFKENHWICYECGFKYEEYGPQYHCPCCDSEEIDLDEDES